jgi:hypothetical protein
MLVPRDFSWIFLALIPLLRGQASFGSIVFSTLVVMCLLERLKAETCWLSHRPARLPRPS